METLIGVFLLLIVFLSIFGVFNLGIKLVGRSKAKAGAVALAQEQMEAVRNIPYDDLGTVGGIPAGNLPQEETITLNDIVYTRRTSIRYVDDPQDGLGDEDENGITADYKSVRVEVSWSGAAEPVVFLTNIVPKGIETVEGGGTLIITVFDASVQPVPSATVHIENSSTSPPISVDYYTNTEGKVIVPGAPSASSYEVTVSKDGYSTAQTYDAVPPNINPDPGHLTIIEGQTTEASFVIDRLSSKTVRTWEPIKNFVWYDNFDDWSKIATSSNIDLAAGKALLAEIATGTYTSSGFLQSADIGGISNLVSWGEFSWQDSQPASTTIVYQVLYYNGSNLEPVPDADLPGNETGFTSSPVDLSGLSTTTYPTLRLKAQLSTGDSAVTPQIDRWQISWNAGPNPLPNIPFHMQGEKIIGTDVNDDSIYKYSEDLSTHSSGVYGTDTLEFDNYTITIDQAGIGYDISEICPWQPVSIAPGTSNTTDIYLVNHTANSLLVAVKDSSDAMVEGAQVRLYKTGYDESKDSSACGQAFFGGLENADYSLEVSKAGFATATTTVTVDGQTTAEIILNEL